MSKITQRMLTTAKAKAVQKAMSAELRRTMKGMRLKGHPAPFYVGYLTHVEDGLDVWGRYGSIFASGAIRSTGLFADVRVGSYRLDQSVDGNLQAEMEDRESYNWIDGPHDLDPEAVRYAFWRLTQVKYAEALQDYYDKRKILIDERLRQDVPSLSREEPFVLDEPLRRRGFDREEYEAFVRRTSRRFRRYRHVDDPYVQLRSVVHSRVLVNSEGARVVTQDLFHEVIVSGWTLTPDGTRLQSQLCFYGRHDRDLPSTNDVEKAADRIAADLKAQAKASPMEPYAGPALLSGVAAGIVFHEAIGHRLEGERLIARNEGHTFANKVGKRILPRGIDLVDDPSLERFDGKPLYGHYRVDDEGVAAQPVTLVEDGVLKAFLTSRACVPGQRRSTGHGRHERFQPPMARMANLIVKSRQPKGWAELKAQLMEEVKRRELPYGIIVRDAVSGETATTSESYEFQAFKGNPTEVYTVDPDTGVETRVRDVSFIGTPLAAVQGILALGDDYEVDNSYCYAESGSVPVGTVAPALLVAELELQKSGGSQYRRPVLSMPPMKR